MLVGVGLGKIAYKPQVYAKNFLYTRMSNSLLFVFVTKYGISLFVAAKFAY